MNKIKKCLVLLAVSSKCLRIHHKTNNIHVRFICYLTAYDFYLWGNLKNIIYKTNPHTIDELKQNIRTEINAISEAELMCVNANFLRQCRRCIDVEGQLFYS